MTKAAETAPEYLMHLPWARHYLPQLNPHAMRFAAALGGIDLPCPRRVAELAYGQGLSLVIHAAANPAIAWSGTDLNPGHAAFARGLAEGLCANLMLHDADFAGFSAQTAGHAFDLVCMTGTWSWIPPSARGQILSLLETRLAPEGAFAGDCLTLPGQADAAATRALFHAFAGFDPQQADPSGTSLKAALDRIAALAELEPQGVRSIPGLNRLLDDLRKAPEAELAHEYVNHHWAAFTFAELAGIFRAAHFEWACPWNMAGTLRNLDFTPDQQDRLDAMPDRIEREMAADFLCNRAGRQDLWQRQPRWMGAAERESRLRAAELVLVRPASQFAFTARGALGEVLLERGSYGALLAALDGGGPLAIGTLAESAARSMDFATLAECCAVFIAEGWVQVANPDPAERAAAAGACQTLNARILAMVEQGEWCGAHLASPITGGGIPVSGAAQVLLAAWQNGADDAPGLARRAMSGTAQGKPAGTDPGLPGDAPQWEARAVQFLELELPLLRALGVTSH